MVLYGNAWQGDVLRYAADLGILEGHGVAIVSSDGATGAPSRQRDRSRARRGRSAWRGGGASTEDISGRGRRAACLLRQGPHGRGATALAAELRSSGDDRGFVLEDGTALLDELLMHKLPAEIDAVHRAAALADDAYAAFRAAVRAGRRQYEIVAEIEGALRCGWLSRQFHDHGIGRQGRARHAAGIRAAHRGRRSRHQGAHARGRGLFRADLPHPGRGRVRASRNGALSPSFARRWRPESRRCGRARLRPTSRGRRTTCFAGMGLATTPRTNGRACAGTAWGCSAMASRICSRTSTTPLAPG